MKFATLLKYFLIWQLAILAVTFVSPRLFPLREMYLGGATQAYQSNPLLYSRSNFDGNLYVSIAQNGYSTAQQAFFPLYPKLIRALSEFVYPPALAGIYISALFFLAALYVFARLIRLDYPESTVRWTVILLLVFPVSFFLTFVYTEGLFFFLMISSFYLARTRRFGPAVILGALASYTRLAGIFLLPALAAELWIQQSSAKKYLWLLVVPVGLLVFMYYLNQSAHDPLAFIHSQPLFGQNRSDKIILIYQVIWRYLKMIFTVNRSDPSYLTILLEFAVGILFLVTSVYSLIKHRLSYAIFGFLAYLVPTFTGTFGSLPRYVLVCFPSFILFGQIMSGSPHKKLYLGVCAILFVLFLTLFVRGYWVA